MKGKLYGVGISIGDPELLTLKALRIMRECDIIALPKDNREDCVAWQAAVKVAEDIKEKEILCVTMPMTKDKAALEKAHETGAALIEEVLDEGKNVAFLTIGDPCVYATYMYVHKKVAMAGYDTEIINGITSFCAAASAINIPLCEENQELHIIPSSYGIEDALNYPGVKVLMKSASKLPKVIEAIRCKDREECNKNLEAYMVENCGMKDEKIYIGLDSIEQKDMDSISYYTTIIVKEKSYD